jgi:hypothetical protein
VSPLKRKTSQASQLMRNQSMVLAECTQIPTKPLASPIPGAFLNKKLSQMHLGDLANTKSFISVLSPTDADKMNLAERLELEIEDSVDHSPS